MKAQKIIFILVLIFFLGGLAYFVFQIWQNRYDYFFQGGELKNIKEDVEETTPPFSTTSISISPSPSVSDSPDLMTEREKIQDILDNHCNQGCRRKTEISEKKYCLEICGLNLPEEISKEDDCEKKTGQEADICWKNLAIFKKSGVYCDKIQDQGIKESCQNRIIEEFLD